MADINITVALESSDVRRGAADVQGALRGITAAHQQAALQSDVLRDRFVNLRNQYQVGAVGASEYAAALRTLKADIASMAQTTRMGAEAQAALANTGRQVQASLLQVSGLSQRYAGGAMRAAFGVQMLGQSMAQGRLSAQGLSAALLTMSVGNPVLMGLLAGLAAVASAYHLITERAKKAQEAAESAAEGLRTGTQRWAAAIGEGRPAAERRGLLQNARDMERQSLAVLRAGRPRVEADARRGVVGAAGLLESVDRDITAAANRLTALELELAALGRTIGRGAARLAGGAARLAGDEDTNWPTMRLAQERPSWAQDYDRAMRVGRERQETERARIESYGLPRIPGPEREVLAGITRQTDAWMRALPKDPAAEFQRRWRLALGNTEDLFANFFRGLMHDGTGSFRSFLSAIVAAWEEAMARMLANRFITDVLGIAGSAPGASGKDTPTPAAQPWALEGSLVGSPASRFPDRIPSPPVLPASRFPDRIPSPPDGTPQIHMANNITVQSLDPRGAFDVLVDNRVGVAAAIQRAAREHRGFAASLRYLR